MRMVPVFFGTTTMAAHQGVDSSTFEITCIDSIRLIVLPWCAVALGHCNV